MLNNWTGNVTCCTGCCLMFDLDQHPLYYRMVSRNLCQLPWLAVPIIVGCV